MLYLEDYLENIEHLPQEMRNRFTKMREMDLQVENSMDCIKKNVDTLFLKADNLKPEELETNFKAIMKEGEKSVEQSDEKVTLANHMHDLMSKYLRRLDHELHKFKMELEADHSGITGLIEKRSLDSEQSNIIIPNQKENKYQLNRCLFGDKQEALNHVSTSKQKSTSIASNSTSSGDVASPSQRDTSPANSRNVSSSLAYTLGHMGAGSPAIAAAASQAIVATQQLSQGRRTASLKASLEAINSGATLTGQMSSTSGVLPSELPISKELAGVAHLVNPNIDGTRKHRRRGGTQNSQTSTEEDVDEPIDPNEPRYCICNQVAYGTMVACDNKGCPYEWYHCECVGITDPPKGKWYCPQCITTMKSRRSRKTT
ncbi:inhibitor of growth protein 3 isoform X2 [Acyrthosiphon pisum]|uniref:Inhibitor of growth protein n=1 Tax=Acyrthosiphon pisum TaxID=7029 RepID=A0A8R1W243_ACYPI|nr:inhibitor of growth protein 3 isoform X2 [Acyrthosiphon pisum]|eukprot:XP_001949763.1 PREDICTED: inhibitor of growth protein 3 isoform X1 [Acyrthosiphon pisum]